MNAIAPSPNKYQWPRHAVKSVEARKRDLLIRITDVEVYIGGVYDFNESESHTFYKHGTKEKAKAAAIAHAQAQIAKLL